MVIEVIHATGTILLQEQYRNIKLKSEKAMIDSTAGTVEWQEFIAGLKSWTVDYEGLSNGTGSPVGATDIGILRDATGTLRISPHGTTTGKPRYVGSFLSSSVEQEWPYDDVAPNSITFQGSGALTDGTW